MLVEQGCVDVATLLTPLLPSALPVQVGKQLAKLGVSTSNCGKERSVSVVFVDGVEDENFSWSRMGLVRLLL